MDCVCAVAGTATVRLVSTGGGRRFGQGVQRFGSPEQCPSTHKRRYQGFLDSWVPFDAPKYFVDYDLQKISQQAYRTNGRAGVVEAPFDFRYSMRMITPIPNGMHPHWLPEASRRSSKPERCWS